MKKEEKVELLFLGVLVIISALLVQLIVRSHGFGDPGVVVFWILLSVVAETFLIVGPSGICTSVGMSIYLAIIITVNPLAAVIASGCGMLLRFPEINGKRTSFVNSRPYMTAFNMVGAGMLPVALAGLVYTAATQGSTSLSAVVFGSVAAILAAELFSIVNISLYMYFVYKETTQSGRSLLGVMPSTLAVGALGMLLAFAMNAFGELGVALFFLPLLLARYSFKLYFESQKAGFETIHALNEALCVRDAYTGGHTSRVEKYSLQIAKACGYSKKEMEQLKTAAFLHDIGKIGIPDSILNKPGKLTNEEYDIIKSHCAMGAQILSNVDSLRKIAVIVKCHHERPDGRGYPEGLRGAAIPKDASILALADTYDAMTTDRPYRKGLTKEEAIKELEKYKGQQFDLDLADIFIDILKASPDESQEMAGEEAEAGEAVL